MKWFKKEIKKCGGFELYDIVETCNGIGVIMEFKKANDRDDKEYMGALIRYTKPYVSYSFQSIYDITKDFE